MATTSKPSETTLIWQILFRSLQKSDTNTQHYVKQEKETSGDLLIWQGLHSWPLGEAFPDNRLCVPTSYSLLTKCLSGSHRTQRAVLTLTSPVASAVGHRKVSEWIRGRIPARKERCAFNDVKARRCELLRKEKGGGATLQAWAWTWLYIHLFFLLASWGLFISLFLGTKILAFSPYH